MKLKTIITVIALSLPFLAFAQNAGEGVQFIENQSLANVLAKAKAEGKMVFVDCYTSWCGPCKMMHPILEQLKEKMGDDIRILKVDVDKNEALSMQYRIQSVPTLMLFKKGEMLWRQSGAMSLNDLMQKISQLQ